MQGMVLFIAMAAASISAGTASPALVKDYIAAVATLNGVPVAETLHIAEAESGFNNQAVGDHGTSIGVWQIHLPAHPDISQAEATDTIFSTNWAVNQLKNGQCKIWSTCDLSLNGD